jgi:hypothetical protein
VQEEWGVCGPSSPSLQGPLRLTECLFKSFWAVLAVISPFNSLKFGLDALTWNIVYFLYVLGLNMLEPLHLYPEFGEYFCLFMEFWILGDNCF